MKFTLSLMLIAFCGTTALAQHTSTATGNIAAQANVQDLANNGIARGFDNRYEGTRGTPYFIDEFATASVIFENNKTVENLKIKYNIFDNTILFISTNGEHLVFDTNKVNRIVLTHPVLHKNVEFKKSPELIALEPKMANSLVINLFDGKKTKFVLNSSKELIKADHVGSTYGASRNYDEFKDKNNYYVIKRGVIEKTKLNKKSLLAVLEDKSKEVNEFIVREKIDVATEQGWIKALNFYDTL